MAKMLLKMLLIRVLLSGVTLVALGQAAENRLPVDLKLSTEAASKYVWRGQLLTDDPVLQPSATVSAYGLSLNAWGSFDTTDIHEGHGDTWHLQEADYTASYGSSPVSGLDLTGGLVWYTFPGTAYAKTTELFASVALSKLILAPTLSVYRDVDEAHGWYANLGLGHTVNLTEQLSLSLGAGVGWADGDYHAYYFGLDHAALSDLLLSTSLAHAVTENLTLSLYLRYSEIINRDLHEAAAAIYPETDVVFGGASVAFAF